MTNPTVDQHDARMHVICQASYQVEKILDVLQTAATAALKGEKEGLEYLILGLTPRLQQLNSVIMSGANDDAETAQGLLSRMSN